MFFLNPSLSPSPSLPQDYILCLQKCNLLQRYNTTTWLELAHAYPTLSTKSIFSNTDVTSEMFAAILGNTVTLFRPYFKWTNGKEKLEISREIETSTRLLGRQLSVEEFLSDLIQLPWEQREELLRVLFQMSSCCCLIWARYNTNLHKLPKKEMSVTDIHYLPAGSCRYILPVTVGRLPSKSRPRN